ncbi:MAG: PQQ-binding-like beta-propeller repeat protein [Planctomycetota bacterium]|nr:PQQ-binding-like beta-propeller repeat protein [Planctomycetota bacterium]
MLWSRQAEGTRDLQAVEGPVQVDDDDTPDLLITRRGNGQAFAIEAISGATGASLWRLPIPSHQGAVIQPLVTRIGPDAVIVVATSDRILTLKLADGTDANAPIELAPAQVRDVQIIEEPERGLQSLLVLTAPEPKRKEPQGSTLHAYEFGKEQPRWTRELAAEWTKTDRGDAPADWPLVADLDGDGTPEIVVPSRRLSSNEAGYSLEVLDSTTGEPRWSRFWFDDAGRALVQQSTGDKALDELGADLSSKSGAFAAVASLAFGGRNQREQIDRLTAGPDIDNDGCSDLFCANFQGKSLYVTALSGADGRTLWWWRQGKMDRAKLAPLTFWESGSDGFPLLMVNYDNEEKQGNITSWGGVKSLPTRSQSLLLSSSRGEVRDVIHGAPHLQVTDLNGDGISDLLSTRQSNNPERSRFAVTTSINGIAGQPPQRYRRLGRLEVAADFNNDGIDDLVGDGIAVSGNDGSLLWRNKNAKGLAMAPAPFGDLNGDGIADLIYSRLDLEAFSGLDGEPLWDLDTDALVPSEDADLPAKGVSRGSGDPKTILVDLDGDKKPELLHFFSRRFATDANFDNLVSEQRLAAVDANSGAVLWSAPIGPVNHRGQCSEPSCGDIDGDGTLEIALVITDEDNVWNLRVMDGRDGSMRWTQLLSKQNYGNRNRPPHVQLTDLDGDGLAEVVTIDRVVELTEPLVKERGSSSQIYVKSAAFRVQARNGEDGKLLWSWSAPEVGAHQISDTDASWLVNAAVADIAPHGTCLCIQLISHGLYEDKGGVLGHRGIQEAMQSLVLDGKGKLLFLGKPSSSGSRSYGLRHDYAHACDVAALDLDGDGSEEVLWADPGQVLCTNGLPNEVRWQWTPTAPTKVGTFDASSRRGQGLRLMPVDDSQLLVVPIQRKLRTADFTRTQHSLALLDAEGNRRFDLAGREWLEAAGSALPLSIQSENGATSCLVGVTANPTPTSTSESSRLETEPDPRYARSLPWYHRGELTFFWSKILDSLALLVVPLALLLWAWRWRSWAVGGVFVGYLVLASVAIAFGQLPVQQNLSGLSSLGYAIDLTQRMPWLAWLSIGPVHPGMVLLALPLLAFAGLALVWLVRRRWLRLGALVVATTALSGGLVAWYLRGDAGSLSPQEHYVWTGAWRVVLHAVYLIGLLLLAYATFMVLHSIWRRFRKTPRVAT